MKKHTDKHERWEALVRQARADEAPEIDGRVLRAAIEAAWRRRRRGAGDVAAGSWRERLAAWRSPGLTWCCSGGMAACAMLVGWVLWQAWNDLAWAAFAGFGLGGAL